jgi:hypothetical protein
VRAGEAASQWILFIFSISFFVCLFFLWRSPLDSSKYRCGRLHCSPLPLWPGVSLRLVFGFLRSTETNSSNTLHPTPHPYYTRSESLFHSPAASASVSAKQTPCTCTPLFHGFSLLSAQDCMRHLLLAGPSCHRLHAECKYGVCWKWGRIWRGERNCWPC